MKNILLTGSGGFLGSHLKKYLTKYNLFTPRSFELNLLNEAETTKYLKENNIEFILHCASCGVRISSDATMDEVAAPNIKMFNNLAKSHIPMITIGSGAEYDKTNDIVKIKEKDFGKSVPKDPYGYSKYLISKEIEKYNHILNLRVFGIYGENEDKSRVTTDIITSNLDKKAITLNQNVIFDFIWIEDFCKITEFFIKNFPNEKFINVTPTESVEILELAEIVNNFSTHKSEIIIKNNGFNKEYTGDNSRLIKYIGDFKFTSYKDGMYDLYNIIKQKKEEIC